MKYAVSVELVRAGEPTKKVRVPRCAKCAKVHSGQAAMGLAIFAGLIIALIVWWKAGWLWALLAFAASCGAGYGLQQIIAGSKRANVTVKTEDQASAWPGLSELQRQGWQLPADAKREQARLFNAIKQFDTVEVERILNERPEYLNHARIIEWASPLQYAFTLEPVVSATEAKENGKNPLAVIELLVRKGATLEVLDSFGGTLLHQACQQVFLEGAEYLIKTHHFNVNARNESGLTPLHLAARHFYPQFGAERRAQLVELLVSLGAQINATDSNNDTPLILAIPSCSLVWDWGVLQTVKMLLALGADTEIRSNRSDRKGLTAYQLLLTCEKSDEYNDVLALFEGGKRVGICEVCGGLIFEGQPFFERREFGTTPVSGGILHYNVGRGLCHQRCFGRS